MAKAQYEKRLAELEAEADKRGCCVIPARPLREPASTKHQRGKAERKHQTPKASKEPAPKARRK